ncbi:linear amide C-N hydrolase [Ferrovibrio terrae]|uniref:linear amide C-N hydrolase n=1 Tax=Ferrovibrio terrae TaxID=2594003 RepID=UPI003137AD80
MCTAFQVYSANNFAITGRSLDYDQASVFTTSQSPAGKVFKSVLNNGVEWTSKYGLYTVDFQGSKYNIPFEGMNSQGIGISGNLANASYPTDNPGPTISSDDIVNYVLAQAGSILEAANYLTTINIDSKWQYHYIVFDSQGDSLVVEYKDHEPISSFNMSSVMTNNPGLNFQLENQNDYANIRNWFPGAILPDSGDQFHGQGMLGLPGDWMSTSRYTRVSTLLEYCEKFATTPAQGLNLAKRILESASLIKGVDLGGSATGNPIYSQIQIVKDLVNSIIYTREYDASDWAKIAISW